MVVKNSLLLGCYFSLRYYVKYEFPDFFIKNYPLFFRKVIVVLFDVRPIIIMVYNRGQSLNPATSILNS